MQVLLCGIFWYCLISIRKSLPVLVGSYQRFLCFDSSSAGLDYNGKHSAFHLNSVFFPDFPIFFLDRTLSSFLDQTAPLTCFVGIFNTFW
jgi:hypothetical protein